AIGVRAESTRRTKGEYTRKRVTYPVPRTNKTRIQLIQPAGTQPLGPYSPAVAAGDTVYVSGQIPRDLTGKMVDDSIESATTFALENMRVVLAAAGCTPADVVKTTVFLRDLADFAGMNKAYAAFFGEHRPARSA